MAGGRGIMDSILASGGSEETSAVSVLFDTKDFQRLKMISEVPPSLIYVFTVLGLLQKRYKSKLLKDFITEYLSIQKSKDRQGIVELVEVILGMRRSGDLDE